MVVKLDIKPVKLARDYKGLTVVLERNHETGLWDWHSAVMTRTTYSDAGFADSEAAFRAAQSYLDVVFEEGVSEK